MLGEGAEDVQFLVLFQFGVLWGREKLKNSEFIGLNLFLIIIFLNFQARKREVVAIAWQTAEGWKERTTDHTMNDWPSVFIDVFVMDIHSFVVSYNHVRTHALFVSLTIIFVLN